MSAIERIIDAQAKSPNYAPSRPAVGNLAHEIGNSLGFEYFAGETPQAQISGRVLRQALIPSPIFHRQILNGISDRVLRSDYPGQDAARREVMQALETADRERPRNTQRTVFLTEVPGAGAYFRQTIIVLDQNRDNPEDVTGRAIVVERYSGFGAQPGGANLRVATVELSELMPPGFTMAGFGFTKDGKALVLKLAKSKEEAQDPTDPNKKNTDMIVVPERLPHMKLTWEDVQFLADPAHFFALRRADGIDDAGGDAYPINIMRMVQHAQIADEKKNHPAAVRLETLADLADIEQFLDDADRQAIMNVVRSSIRGLFAHWNPTSAVNYWFLYNVASIDSGYTPNEYGDVWSKRGRDRGVLRSQAVGVIGPSSQALTLEADAGRYFNGFVYMIQILRDRQKAEN